MKIFLCAVISLIVLPLKFFPQTPDTLWTRFIDVSNFDLGESVQQTLDNGFIICGHNELSGSSDIWLIKTNSTGDTIWTKTFNSGGSDRGFSVQQTFDEGYILTGWKDAFGPAGASIWLIKTNNLGDTLWTKSFGDGFCVGRFVEQTMDGGYIIVGENNMSAWLIKTDPNGDTIWTKKYLNILTSGLSLDQTSDGGYVFTGYINDLLGLVKTNSLGDTIWTKTFIYGRGESVQQTFDGGYIITGKNSNWGILCLIKTYPEGNIEWEKRFGYSSDDYGYSVEQTKDSGFVLAGYCSFSAGDHRLWVIKTNSFGDTIWTKNFNSDLCSEGYSIKQTSDDGYIVTGTTRSIDYNYNLWLIRIESDTVTTSIEFNNRFSQPEKFFLSQNYPNPFNPSTKISWQVPLGGWQTLKIYDMLGNEVATLIDEYKPAGKYEVEFSIHFDEGQNLSSGVYFYTLTAGNFRSARKLIFLK
jgi:hypothetical protein